MADRLSNGHSDRVTLPISRYDIADYLAVSVETVSRALSELKQRGLIRFTGTRVIQIIDREALEDGKHDDVLRRTPPAAANIRSPPFCKARENRKPDSLGELTHAQAVHHTGAVNLDRAHADTKIEGDDLVRPGRPPKPREPAARAD